MIEKIFETVPVIAILRGIQSHEVVEVGKVLYDRGVRCIEVPLNSPSPFDSIAELASKMPSDCVVGAGTVLAVEDVRKVRDAGGTLIVAPNTSCPIIQLAITLDMHVIPGVATPTEAFEAIRSGAKYLKLFPAGTFGPGHLESLRAVLPQHVKVFAVGDMDLADFAAWRAAGAVGFGLGSNLYRAGDSVEVVRKKIDAVVTAMEGA